MKQTNGSKIEDRNIYYDDRGRAIYSDRFTKHGYIISNAEKKTMTLFLSRELIILLICFTLLLLKPDYFIIEILGCILLYALTTLLLHKWFLPKLSVLKSFEKPKKEKYFTRVANQRGVMGLVIYIVLSQLFALCLILNAKQQGYTGSILYGNYALALGASAFGFAHIASIIIKLKKK